MAGKLQQIHMDQLEQWIGTGPKDFQLLYSAKRDGCVATTFHQKCDNQGPTVSVLHNTNNSVYGGYTSVSWTSTATYVNDAKAFLFQLMLNGTNQYNKFPVFQHHQNAVYHHPSRGPTFGGGHDLYTFANTVNLGSGYFTLNGTGLNMAHTYSANGIQMANINNGHMQVYDLEVYKVVDGKRKVVPQKPWRKCLGWDETVLGQLMEQIENFEPERGLKVSQARILLLGPVGSGKSSFFNTINSIFRGRVSHRGCSGSADRSLTTVYRQYQIRSAMSGSVLNFRLCDTRGAEEGQGFDIFEIDHLLEGNVPDWYQFNPSVPVTSEVPGFISKPNLNDKMHCVAFVIDGTTFDVTSEKVLQKIRAAQERMNQKGIPQIVLLTKVDKVCDQVEEDVSKVFKSEKVKTAVEKVSQTFGVPRGNVLPVKNYENEIELETNTSILALFALRQILHFADDFLGNCLEKLETENLHRMNIKD